MKQTFMVNSVIQFVLLLGLWLLLSGHYDMFHVGMGVLSALVVVWLHIRLRKNFFYGTEQTEAGEAVKGEAPMRLRYGRVLFYIPWLIWQIVVASLQVAAVVLSPKMPIDPSLVRFKTKLPTTGAKVILGNSITLTPGTITVQVKEDEFIVHSVMDASSGGIVDGSLPGEVAKLYEQAPGQVVQDIKIIRTGADI